MHIELTTFNSRDAERITGLTADVQRDWRRHGYLRRHKGHAKYHIGDLAAMIAMRQLSERGIGPALTFPYSNQMSVAVAFHCLSKTDAIQADWGKFIDENDIELPSPPIKDMIKRAKADGDDDRVAMIKATIVPEKLQLRDAERVAARFVCDDFRESNTRLNEAYLGIWYNDIFDVNGDQEKFLQVADSNPEAASIAVMIAFHALAAQIMLRAATPLATISLNESAPE